MVMVFPCANFLKGKRPALAHSYALLGVKLGIIGVGRVRGGCRPAKFGRIIHKCNGAAFLDSNIFAHETGIGYHHLDRG